MADKNSSTHLNNQGSNENTNQLEKEKDENVHLKDQLEKEKDENTHLKDQLEKEKYENTHLNDPREKEKIENAYLKDQLQKEINEKARLKDELELKDNEITDLKDQLKKEINEKARLEDELELKDNEITDLKDQLKKEKIENAHLNDPLEKEKNENADLKDQQEKEKNENAHLKDQQEKEKNEHADQDKERLGGLWYILAGKTNNSHKKFIETLKKAIPNMKDASTVDESDVVVVFCPIVSRAGTDIEAALKQFADFTEKKLKVLVVLHHTFDKEKTVPESSRCVNRKDILTVDCLFYEETGLLECQKNQDAMDKVVNCLKDQVAKRRVIQNQNSQSSSSIGNYSVKLFVKGDQQAFERFFKAGLSNLKEISGLRMVSEEQECDVILHIYPVSSKRDCVAALKECNKTEKLLVLVLLHPTLETNYGSDSRFGIPPNTFLVDCAISEGGKLISNPDLPAISQWLSTKLGQSINEEGSQQHQMTDNKQNTKILPWQPKNSNTESIRKCTIL